MIDIPIWLKKDIKKHRCLQCQKVMVEKGISGVGIRDSSENKGKTVFFFEYVCSCGKAVIVEGDFMTIEDFVSDMVQEYTEGIEDEMMENTDPVMAKRESVKNKGKRGSKISSEEIKDMVNDLKNFKYWDDFLIRLGFSSQEIEQHKIDGVEEYKQRKNGG